MSGAPACAPPAARRFWLRLGAWLVFGPLLVESVRATVAWWEEPASVTGWDFGWVLLLPALILIWFRYLSIFRCNACG